MLDNPEVDKILTRLVYQYPPFPTTYCECPCGRGMARGGRQCGMCLEDELATHIGREKAAKFHKITRDFCNLND